MFAKSTQGHRDRSVEQTKRHGEDTSRMNVWAKTFLPWARVLHAYPMAEPCRRGSHMKAYGGMASGSGKHMPQAAEEMVLMGEVMLYSLPSALALAWMSTYALALACMTVAARV